MKYRVLLMAVVLGAACSESVRESAPRWDEEDAVSERTFLPGTVETEWRGGGADTTLLDPWWLSAGPDGVTVWDDGRKAVVRISREGVPMWSFGREGRGSGEFRSVRGVAHLPDGGAAVVDDRNRRLTVITPDGQLAGETELGLANPMSVAGLPGGGVVVLTDQADPFRLFDTNQSLVNTVAFPWEPYRDMPSIARQGRVLGIAEGWVFGFSAGNGWWRFGERGDAEGFPYAEHVDFPAIQTSGIAFGVRYTVVQRPVESNYTSSAMSFGARGDTLFVHFDGRSAGRWRLLDLFDLGTGAYIGTVRLPVTARRIAIGPDVIYALDANAHPALTALRRVERAPDQDQASGRNLEPGSLPARR